MKKLLIILIILGVAGAGSYFFYFKPAQNNITSKLDMVKVEKGYVHKQISSSGTIEPRNVVEVGTQVSGIIEEIFVDYNDEVKAGQLIATLDKYLLDEEAKEKQSNLNAATSKLKIAKLNLERNQKLFKEGYISQTELEEYEIALANAQYVYDSAIAAMNKANRNLGYARITSPVDGTIISKEVEVGQTVAASLSTPTLFKIAQDLTKMQIETSISEADIGMIKSGMATEFTVDAYPAYTFKGKIGQIRLNPSTESNVVIYTVIIDIENEDKKLLPGMTAFVNISIDKRENVPVIPKSALQFKLPANLRSYVSSVPPSGLKYEEAVVYKLNGDKITPVVITTGLSDDSFTEVTGGLKQGEEIISEYNEKGVKKSGGSHPPPM